MRRVLAVWFVILTIPWLVTLVWTGQVQGDVQEHAVSSGKIVILERENGSRIMDVEEYLIGVMAVQIPPEYGMETLRAQAVIDRTYIYRILGERTEVMEEELDLDYMEWSQMAAQWGQLTAAENYQLFREAAVSTAGTVMAYDGALAEPLFHRVSAGRTRSGDTELFPYLVGVDSPRDIEAENYLQVVTMSEQEFAQKINEIPDHEGNPAREVFSTGIFESIQIVEKEEAGYVVSLQIGGNTYTGEEVQCALGLASSCFSIGKEQDGLRIVVKGIGHGYGMSQYGASVLAADGWKAEDILSYYYQNIVLIFE